MRWIEVVEASDLFVRDNKVYMRTTEGPVMLIGPASSAKERDLFLQRILRNPESYIAQPTLSLSTHLCGTGDRAPACRSSPLRVERPDRSSGPRRTATDPRLRHFSEEDRDRTASDPVAALHSLAGRIRAAVRHVKGTTTVQTTAAEVLSQGSGVCQDHSHLFIVCCRILGLPARYISGYLYTGTEANPELAMHALAEAWVDRIGWLSFDISNGSPAEAAHLRLGLPIDLLCCERDRLRVDVRRSIDQQDPYFREIKRQWAEGFGKPSRAFPDPC